jgi:hypothetical protein
MRLKPWRGMAGIGFVVLTLFAFAGCQSNAANAGAISKATTGPVRITLDHTAYGINDPVGVTVSNTSKGLYYSLDGKSACTILELQKYDTSKKQWVMTNACTVASPVHALQVPAGIAEPFSLAPGSTSDENSWQKGTYRIAVVYSDNADGTSGAQTAYSADFAIS